MGTEYPRGARELAAAINAKGGNIAGGGLQSFGLLADAGVANPHSGGATEGDKYAGFYRIGQRRCGDIGDNGQ